MASSSHHGTEVNTAALRQWLAKKKYGLREFQREAFKAAQQLADFKDHSHPRKSSVHALVKRWHVKLLTKQPLYVIEPTREILECLGGDEAASWFPFPTAKPTQSAIDDANDPQTTERALPSGADAQNATQVRRSAEWCSRTGLNREAIFDEIFRDDYPKEGPPLRPTSL